MNIQENPDDNNINRSNINPAVTTNNPKLYNNRNNYNICRYIINRFKNSNIWRFTHHAVTRKEADIVVNTTSLVAALLLTIPFQVAGNFDYSYWDWLDQTMSNCNLHSEYTGNNSKEVKKTLKSLLYMSVITSVFTLLGTLCYYVFRPFDDDTEVVELSFGSWFKRGRFFLAMMMISVLISAAACWFILSIFTHGYIVQTSTFCEEYMGIIEEDFAGYAFYICCLLALIIIF